MKNNTLKNTICLILGLLATISCQQQYLVEGQTTIQELDGKTLYLRVFREDRMVDIDSTEVVHGKFSFKGPLDSIMMVNLFVGSQSIMPLVVESGEIKLSLNVSNSTLGGSPLNDSLYNFLKQKSILDDRMAELPRRESRMIMDGYSQEEIISVLGKEAQNLNIENDRLVTKFIKTNYNNVLGPGVFMIMTSGFDYPVLTPQIDEILLNAPDSFKESDYVSKYIKAAKENMEL